MKKALSYVGLALIPILILVWAQAPLLSLQNDLTQLRQEYRLALQSSRLQLTETAHDVRGNLSLEHNLNAEGFSAAGRILNGFLKAGQVDYLAIVDQNCHILARSEQGVSLTETCPLPGFAPSKEPLFQWQAMGNTPRLDLITPLTSADGSSLFLLSSIFLNDDWINTYPQLKQSFRSNDIELGGGSNGSSGVLVQEEGRDDKQLAVANLYTQNLWLRLLPQLRASPSLTLAQPLIAAMALLLVTLANLYRALRRRESELAQATKQLLDWSQTLASNEQEAPGAGASQLDAVHWIQEHMNRLVKSNYESIQRFQHQNRLLQQQIVGLEGRLMEHQSQQTWLHQMRSLHEQMLSCGTAHIAKLVEVFSLGEDLSHLAAHQLARPAQRLFELTSRWELELTQVAPRKFLRSLSERLDADGLSELDQGLQFVLEQSHDLNNNAINLTLLAQRLLQDLKLNLQLAEHWHQMISGQEQEQHSLLHLVKSGQALIKLQDNSLQLRYENLLQEEVNLGHLGIASTTLTSALYHCFLALIEAAREKGASDMSLMSQLKKRGQRSILVLSIKGDWGDELATDHQLPAKAEQHLLLAIQLIQGGPLKISQLPAIQGIQALALMWDRQPAEERDMGLNAAFVEA